MLIFAQSVSLHASRILRPGSAGRVLATFERVCDLVTDDGAVVALAWGGVGDGPLNVVLARGPGAALPAGARAAVTGSTLCFSDQMGAEIIPVWIDLSAAIPWDPRPDWAALRARRELICARAAHIAAILADAGWSAARCGLSGSICASAARGDRAAIRALIGLGPGLTPAGDDWLAGWLLGLRLAPDLTGLRNLSGLVSKTAAGRTTTLSRAFLACAAAGEADARWHALLAALGSEAADERISALTGAILAHGATSGAATLLGFLAALIGQPEPAPPDGK